MLILKKTPKKIQQTQRYKKMKKARAKREHDKKVINLRGKQDYRKYMKHKELLSKLEVEGLKDKFLMKPNKYDKLEEHEKMAIETTRTLSLEEPVYTPRDFADGISTYFQQVDSEVTQRLANSGKVVDMSNQRPYTIEGLCNALFLSKKTFNLYCTDDKYKGYHYVASIAKQMITQKVLEGALMKEFDSQLAKFYLKNVSELNDAKEENTGGGTNNIVFVSVSNREELKQLEEGGNGFNGEIVDADVEEDGTEDIPF